MFRRIISISDRIRLAPGTCRSGRIGVAAAGGNGGSGVHGVRPGGSSPGESSGALPRVSERSLRVRFALEQVPSVTDRAILLLRCFVGLSLGQIAQRLRLCQGEVRARFRKALGRMERELGGWL